MADAYLLAGGDLAEFLCYGVERKIRGVAPMAMVSVVGLLPLFGAVAARRDVRGKALIARTVAGHGTMRMVRAERNSPSVLRKVFETLLDGALARPPHPPPRALPQRRRVDR